MDGVVAAGTEQVYKRAAYEGVAGAGYLTDAIVVPVGRAHLGIVQVGTLVAVQRPVGHTVAGGIAACHQRAAARRTDGGGVGLGEEHALAGQTFHVGGLVALVERGALGAEWHAGVLPAHVVDHEQDDVGALVGTFCRWLGLHCEPGGQQGCQGGGGCHPGQYGLLFLHDANVAFFFVRCKRRLPIDYFYGPFCCNSSFFSLFLRH